MEVLTGATGTNIKNSHFWNVGRDQNNYYQTIVQNGGKKRKINRDPPELSQFTEIKWGNIYKDKDVCYSWRLCSNGKDDTEAAVYTAQIMISGHFGDSKYTVKTYHGRNGKKEWRRDFQRCSGDWHRDIPLFGYNKSSVPSLIFHGELIPIAHIEAQVGWMGQLYFEMLGNALGCLRNELWMNPMKGSFCCGPVGPESIEWFDKFDYITTIPSDTEFLKEDVLIRYFSSIKDDLGLMWALVFSSHFEHPEVPSFHYPHVIPSLTHSTIAFIWNIQWWSYGGCLQNGWKMSDGATRFLLTDHGRYIQVESLTEAASWLSQALSVFHVHNIQFDEDLSNFKFIHPDFKLRGMLQKSKHKCQRRQLGRPIYLIVLPSPSLDSCFYFWSHGQDPLSPDMCRYLGLPITLSITLDHYQYSWPTEIYKTLHNYQVVRGFNPTTTNFVQSIGYPIFEVCLQRATSKKLTARKLKTHLTLMRMVDKWALHLLSCYKEPLAIPY